MTSKDQGNANTFPASYYNVRKKRHGRANWAWWDVTLQIFRGMSNGYCDLDILLDTFSRHHSRPLCVVYWFPGREEGSTPADLVEALRISDATWLWLTQYQLSAEPHPGNLVNRLLRP